MFIRLENETDVLNKPTCLKKSIFPKVAYTCRRRDNGENFNISCSINFLWCMNVYMKQFNYKIHFDELSNKNNYYEMEYKFAEMFIKLEKKVTYCTCA
jgi:hypothetical protein